MLICSIININGKRTLFVPAESIKLYKTAPIWKEFKIEAIRDADKRQK